MKRIYLSIVKRLLFTALSVFSVFTSTNNLYAQSSIGIEFWIAFPQNYDQSGDRQLYITAEQDAVVSINIVNPAFSTTINVAGGTLETVNLPTTVDINSSGSVENKGIHIISDNPVSVYGMNRRDYSTDAFMAIPVDALGTEYYVMSYSNSFVVQMTLVATEDNTTVTLTPTATGVGFTAGVPGNVVLNKGQVFQLSSSNYGADYTGSKVVSDKPVSVFGGNSCANVPIGTAYCDHLVSQIVSTDKWGKSFITVPLATRLAGDIFRIMAQENNTEVSINGSVVATLNAGQFYETSLGSNTYNRIAANKPILVGQYAKGSNADNTISDPFFALVPPDEQFLNNYIVSAGTVNIPNNYLNITSPTANIGTVKVDNVAVPSVSWTPVPGTTFSGAQIQVGNGIHSVTSSLPVGLLVYGFGNDDSYGYTGGQAFGAVATVSSLTISPKTGSGALNTNQCWEAEVLDQFDEPVSGVRVDFNITGVNSGSSGFAFTDESGVATFCYAGENMGVDNIEAVLGSFSDNASFTWGTPDDEAPIIGACGKIYIVQLQKVTYQRTTVYRGKLPQVKIKRTITDNIDIVDQGLKVKFSQTVFTPGDWGVNTETVTATDAAGNTTSCEITVVVRYPLKSGEVDIYAGIAEMDEISDLDISLNVYPNPTTGKLTLDIFNLNNPEVMAVVYNMNGQIVYQERFSTGGQINIDLTGKISGMYLLKVLADDKEFMNKIILRER